MHARVSLSDDDNETTWFDLGMTLTESQILTENLREVNMQSVERSADDSVRF